MLTHGDPKIAGMLSNKRPFTASAAVAGLEVKVRRFNSTIKFLRLPTVANLEEYLCLFISVDNVHVQVLDVRYTVVWCCWLVVCVH